MNEDFFTYTDKRDTGIQVSSENSGVDWKEYAINFVRTYLKIHPSLFVDDLWKSGLDEPSSPRALGSVIQHAAKAEWITEQQVNGAILAQPSIRSNGQLKRIWKSELFIEAHN